MNRKKYEYNQRYAREHFKRIPLDVQRVWYTDILAHAKGRGESVNGFIKRAIRETMERDNVTKSYQIFETSLKLATNTTIYCGFASRINTKYCELPLMRNYITNVLKTGKVVVRQRLSRFYYLITYQNRST